MMLKAERFDGSASSAEYIVQQLDLYHDHWMYLDKSNGFLCKNFGKEPTIAIAGEWIIKFEDGCIEPCNDEYFHLNFEELLSNQCAR